MISHLKLLIILLIITSVSFSQINPGARQIALAHSNISSNSDVFELFNNPAGVGLIQNREIGLFYSPSPFGEKSMSTGYAAYIEPTIYGNFSAGFSIYGFELYKETQFAVAYGKNISRSFTVGGTAIYKNVSIKNYGSDGALLLNVGGIINLTNQFGFGFAVENLTRSSISEDDDQIPTVFWGGIHLNLIEDFSFSSSIRKEIGYDPSLRIGAEYTMLDFIKLRFGAQNKPSIYSGGFGVIYQFVQVDYAVFSHPDLGLTHQFGLIISFKK